MCGIAGFLDFKNYTKEEHLKSMVASMRHRGPDDSGVEIRQLEESLLGLGQARLSIIDLTKAGHQPMTYKHLTIVFNGEIYNYESIKKELIDKGHVFVTQTDTEVILHSFEEWHTQCVNRFIGMFSFVIWDGKEKKLLAFRDRAGVKPFNYYLTDDLFLFGSELKALMAHPKFEKTIDERILPNYFHYGYIAAPHTIFKNTYKLMPGHFLEVDVVSREIKHTKYWALKEFYLKPKLNLGFDELKYEVKTLMQSAFEYRMVADVPVGVFLSGGYDSTAVTALLQSNSSKALRTYTIGFEEGNNEAPFAKEIARYLGTEHSEYICTTKEAQEIIPSLPYYYDEPFGDSSGIPTILVSRLARKEVTVALSADGGDEVFCGYDSYFLLYKYLERMRKLPRLIGKSASLLNQTLASSRLFNTNPKFYQFLSAAAIFEKHPNQQAALLFKAMAEKPSAYIQNLFEGKINSHPSSFEIEPHGFQNPLEIAMNIDFNSYLPNDILTKVDRATMSVSLEGREPFLDHRLVEHLAQVPLEHKFDGDSGKKILKDIVHDFVPREMMNRPKSGFTLPIYTWLRSDLSYLLEEYLSKEALSESGLFNVDFIMGEVEKFRSMKLHYSPMIWYLLMFQMWYMKWMK